MRRKKLKLQFMIPRKRGVLVRASLAVLSLVALLCGWVLADITSSALLLPRSTSHTLDHFRVNRHLRSYLDNATLLIEPSTTICTGKKSVPLIVLVSSSPTRFEQREAIRNTWAKHVPAYFIMGLDGPSVEDLLVENYVEAKKYSDVIIYKFQDHYQNLTLKTGLMIKWVLSRCPEKMFFFKTDDDVLVNPWTLNQTLKDHSTKALIGYKKLNSHLHRDEYNKWYLPRWLLRQDLVPEYLSGTGYLINGRYLRKILNASLEVPMINLEDVYFTYLVSKLKLGLSLTHDHRLSPYKPWLTATCMYWWLGSTHSLTPREILKVWPDLETLGRRSERRNDVCLVFKRTVWSENFLY